MYKTMDGYHLSNVQRKLLSVLEKPTNKEPEGR